MLVFSRCRVSYTDDEGCHSVAVTAETLFEAVAGAVTAFREAKTIRKWPGPETEFRVQVLRDPVEHTIRLKKIQQWSQQSTKGGPAEILRRERVRKMLMNKAS
jgi:hypothetical protein